MQFLSPIEFVPPLGGTAAPSQRAILPTLSGAIDSAWVYADNQILAARIPLARPVTFTKASFRLANTIAGATTDVGIYSADGQTRIWSAGGTPQDGAVKTFVGAAITLDADYIVIAWTSSSAGALGYSRQLVQVQTYAEFIGVSELFNVGDEATFLIAPLTASNGVLPNSLGALATAALGNCPLIVLHN